MPSWSRASMVVWAWRWGSPPLASGRSTSTTLKGLFEASSARIGASITSYGGAATASSEPTAARSYLRVWSGCTSAMRAATLARLPASLRERPRVRLLGDRREAFGSAPHEHPDPDDPGDSDRPEGHVDRRAEALECRLPVVAEQAEDHRPDDAAGCVRDQEAAPSHVRDARQERGVGAQQRHEAPEEDDLLAVACEHVAGDLEVALLHPQLVAVLQEQLVATGPADPVADVVADDRPRRGGCDHAPYLEVPGGAGVDAGGHEHRLAGGRYAEALDADHGEHGEVAEVREQVVDRGGEQRSHRGGASQPARAGG